MKVELDKLTLGYSELSKRVFAGIENKPNQWRHKIDVTNSFLGCVIAKFNGFKETIEDGSGNMYEITVKQIKGNTNIFKLKTPSNE